MMMLPAITDSPPNFLTPRRRPAVSRPLRDEPPAFLCAISRVSLFLVGLLGGLLRRGLLRFGLLGRSLLCCLLGGLGFGGIRLACLSRSGLLGLLRRLHVAFGGGSL